MELIISILILFILVNDLLKISFWKGWQAVVFGVLCGVFVVATYPYAILQSKTQLADYLRNTAALKNMAVVVTLESAVCFAYCITQLQMWSWGAEALVGPAAEMVSRTAGLSRAVYLQTELVFAFPGTDFRLLSGVFALIVAAVFPLLRSFFRALLPGREMRLEIHFLVSLFVCIIGLLTTVNGNVTYQAVREPLDWKALGFAFGLFAALFLAGACRNRWKWIVRQRRTEKKRPQRRNA